MDSRVHGGHLTDGLGKGLGTEMLFELVDMPYDGAVMNAEMRCNLPAGLPDINPCRTSRWRRVNPL